MLKGIMLSPKADFRYSECYYAGYKYTTLGIILSGIMLNGIILGSFAVYALCCYAQYSKIVYLELS